MSIEKIKNNIEEKLSVNETLQGFFQAIKPVNIWMYFLIGPLFTLSMKFYYIAVTTTGLHFHRLNLLNKFVEHDFFEFSEIENATIGKGFIQRPIKFTFSTGRKLKLKAQLKGAKKIPKLTPEIQKYIEDRVKIV